MKEQWKRNAVVATVLLFVCAAVYLNWRYAGDVAGDAVQTSQSQEKAKDKTDEGGTTRVLGDATLVGGVPTLLEEDAPSKADPAAAAASSYFDTKSEAKRS